MLAKTNIPLIHNGYSLVVAINTPVKSVSQVINNKKKAISVELKEVMLKSSWSGMMAAITLLLDGEGGLYCDMFPNSVLKACRANMPYQYMYAGENTASWD